MKQETRTIKDFDPIFYQMCDADSEVGEKILARFGVTTKKESIIYTLVEGQMEVWEIGEKYRRKELTHDVAFKIYPTPQQHFADITQQARVGGVLERTI